MDTAYGKRTETAHGKRRAHEVTHEGNDVKGAPAMTTEGPAAADFREAMARLPAAVSVLTTDGPAGRCGLTVSAVCSVTDSPPTLLVCINRRSAQHEVFRTNGRLCLNVLDGGHEELARHFSGATGTTMAERFAWDLWEAAEPVPVLRDAVVAAVGTIREVTPMGSHSVLFMGIERLRIRQDGTGLAWFGRRFHRLRAA
ncbi:flavin reductase [Streptomyces sp. NPDC047117]|uniref:flavin reductase n=1 Tax=Streptomyces sp. NPDC047117 TaxID=3155379 RepID=UPI0033D9E79C